MDALILTVFVSIALVVGEILFFAWNMHHKNHDHVERLALLPLEQDAGASERARSTEGNA